MYFPEAPADLQRTRASYIIECIDSVKSAHPDCGVLLLGDFNTLNVMNILANHTLKQLVREPTRGNNVLDLVISNLASYYNKPVVSAHLGSSDHRSVYWVPNSNHGSNNLTAKKKVVKCVAFQCRHSTPLGDGLVYIAGLHTRAQLIPYRWTV